MKTFNDKKAYHFLGNIIVGGKKNLHIFLGIIALKNFFFEKFKTIL